MAKDEVPSQTGKSWTDNAEFASAYLDAVLQSATASIFGADIDGKIRLWNKASENIFGFTFDDVFGRPLAMLGIEGGKSEILEYEARIKNGDAIANFESTCVRKDGVQVDISFSLAPIKGKSGLLGVSGIARDVSARKQSEQSHRLQSMALQAAANGIVITDRNGHVRWVNAAFTQLTGYDSSEVMGRNLRLLKSDKHDHAFYKGLWDTILAGRIWRGEIYNRRKDGGLYIEEQTITPVMDDSGKIAQFIAIKQDITERERAREEQRKTQDQLRQAQKMEAIGMLAGGVAHDFNNVLFVIIGRAQMALRKVPPEDSLFTTLDQIVKTGDRAAGLTRQLLAFSRRQVLQPKVLDLNAVVTELLKMLSRLIREDIKLNTSLDPTLKLTTADPGQIEQVLLNLVVNARDAMPKGGQLSIETSNAQFDEEYCRVHSDVKPGSYVRLAVKDTGCGMDDFVKAHLFEPFFTTKEPGKGTGLGLATVFGIIKQSNGHIVVESEVGMGTTFNIYLRRTDQPAKHSSPALTAIPGSSQTILLVEDDEQVRQLATEILKADGYKTFAACDGDSALAEFGSNRGKIDLVITDMIMPGMSGAELAEQLRKLQPDIKLLFVSGYVDQAVADHARQFPGVELLQKPVTPIMLSRKVHEVLKQH